MSELIQSTPTAESPPLEVGEPRAVRLQKAGPAEGPELSRLLAAAFSDDPLVSWVFPETEPRREILPALFRCFIAAYGAGDELYITGDRRAGAVCLPAGGQPDEEELAALEEISGPYVSRSATLGELMEAEHPTEPHYYLFFLGTQPQWQGRGIGSAMLEELLEPCDREGVPAYLEATSERNRRLYLRHGFEVTGEVRLPDGPSFWTMWRDPS